MQAQLWCLQGLLGTGADEVPGLGPMFLGALDLHVGGTVKAYFAGLLVRLQLGATVWGQQGQLSASPRMGTIVQV